MTPTSRLFLPVVAAALVAALSGCAPSEGGASRSAGAVPTASYATAPDNDTYLDIQEFRPRGDPRYLCVHAYRSSGGAMTCFLSER